MRLYVKFSVTVPETSNLFWEHNYSIILDGFWQCDRVIDKTNNNRSH